MKTDPVLLIPILASILLPTVLHAQVGDITIVPDQTYSVFPADAEIQSAARIGKMTLVVWGSTVRVGDTADNALYMQMLRGAELLGQPRRLTQSEARPFEMVDVVSLSDRFLVFWSDRRSENAIYVQEVDLEGNSSEERIFMPGRIIGQGIARSWTRNGYVLIWTADSLGRTRLQGRHFSADGSTPGSLMPLSEFHSLSRTVRIDSMSMLFKMSNSEYLLADSTGAIQPFIPAPLRAAPKPHFIRSDGSIGVLENGSSLAIYRSVHDLTPMRRVGLKMVEPLSELSFVTGDSTSGFSVIYCVVERLPATGDRPEWIRAVARRIRVDDTGAGPSTDIAIRGLAQFTPPQASYIWYPNGGSVETYCRDWTNVTFSTRLDQTITVNGKPQTTRLYQTTTFRFTDEGEVLEEEWLTCDREMEVPLRRWYSADSSVVRVMHGIEEIELSAPAAGLVHPNDPGDFPSISLDNGTVLVSWNWFSAISWFSGGNVLAQWSDVTRPPTRIDEIGSLSMRRTYDNTVRYLPVVEARGLYRGTVLGGVHAWNVSNTLSAAQSRRHQFTLTWPTVNGWRTFAAHDIPHGVDSVLTLYSVGDDPVSGTVVSLIGIGTVRRPMHRLGVLVTDKSETSFHTLDLSNPVGKAMIIPVDEDEYLLFTDRHVQRRTATQVFDEFDLPAVSSSTNLNVQRLLGPYFLQTVPIADAQSGVQIDLFGLDGTHLHGREVRFGVSVFDPVTIQRPDSGFVVIVGSDYGVRLTLLDKHLNIERENIQASTGANHARIPSAMINNDTVFIVWKEIVPFVSSVLKGTARVLRDLSGVQDHLGEGETFIDILPRPAHESTVIRLSNPVRHGAMEIVDNRGIVRLYHPLEPGATHIRIETKDLPSGHYTAVLRAGSDVWTAPLIVVH